ncbi:GNAT family N-acetyltransferase [Streptomyces platensis]|uniref:GNAT family N-acetyltransferase n=1 Tax=Streptomyces platensis TaxID=58346 RepID=UPI002252AE49|nr:GNAT family N-acetyltransferase [Streptomyces platensis]MCX4633987.1 GNAT family N-acetyltransferase [Streptomyces platensis]
MNEITFRLAAGTGTGTGTGSRGDDDLTALVELYDRAARWMHKAGIDQWKPGDKDEEHFRLRQKDGEVWLAAVAGRRVGAFELWWQDEPAWGPQPPEAGYVHRLMVDHRHAPPGTGRALLAHAERRIAGAGRPWARLDCVSRNPRLRTYYEGAGYTVVGEHTKEGGGGSRYAVTLLEKRLGA